MAEKIQVGEGGSTRKAARWPFVVVLGVVLLVAIGAGALVRWMQHKNDGPVATKTIPRPPDSVIDAQNLLAAGKTDEAGKYIAAALADPKLSSDERYQLYVEQGRTAQEGGNYQATADAYMKAAAIKETYDVTTKLGATWQQLGNKQKAIEYYKKAIALNPQDNPLREAENNSLTTLIKNLEGQQ